MTDQQFSRALTRLGYTQVGFAEQLQIGERSVRRWASGQWPVPTPIAMLVNLMLDTKSSAEDLRP